MTEIAKTKAEAMMAQMIEEKRSLDEVADMIENPPPDWRESDRREFERLMLVWVLRNLARMRRPFEF